MDVMQRSYSELETHYPEGPLSNISPEEPMRDSMYEATRITEGWEAGNRKAEPAVEKNGCEKTCSDDKCPSPVSWDQENDIDSDDPAVLVGNPARLSGGEGAGASKEPVPDAVRKLNWEKGQIDYLGQDSFENIQRKIEETLTSESKPTPTPFAPAPEEKSAPKPVETTKVTTGVGKISITTSSKKK
ncbi:hypothetical protein DPMN_139757 [Dreissena polymorpha]|uniref:Uncharacterized protein n=1 Tax=Dreissena polymorpha TaxID=45954 RepID=A0A9D4G9K4_DREPO|nr:hypothetical protein DPMN_139757 [Dreissena polymorpha]